MRRRTLDPVELTVIAVEPDHGGRAAFDPYVPLSLEFAPAVAAVANVIIRNDDGTALIECGIDMSTGRLTRATLVMAPAQADGLAAISVPRVTRLGIPRFSTARFDDDAPAPAAELICPILVADDAQRLVARWGDAPADTKLLCGEAYVLLSGETMIGFGADRPSSQ